MEIALEIAKGDLQYFNKAVKKKELSFGERWSKGIPHDPRSIDLYDTIAEIDFEQNDDSLGFKSGDWEGPNGFKSEILMYLFDIYFERRDKMLIRVNG